MSPLGNVIVLACLLLAGSYKCLSATHDMFSCFTDVCNRYEVDQFCSLKERMCRDCSTIRDDCPTLNLPVNCTNWCLQYNKEQALLTAKAQPCPELKEIVNGTYNVSDIELFQPGLVVAVTCNVGYRLTGISILKCRDYGYWSDREPKCEEILCLPLNKIEHGSLNGSLHVQCKPGTIIEYSCNTLFTLVGSTTTACNADGRWTNHPPVCNVWTTIAIAALVCLACLACSLLIWSFIVCIRCHRRKRREERKKHNPSTTKVNGFQNEDDLAESKHLLKTEIEIENDISLQERKHRRQKVVVTDGTESNPEPALAEPNFPTASSVSCFAKNSQVQGGGMQIQFNYNIADPQVVNDGKDLTKGPDASAGETELKNSKTADKISVEESATTPTAQPEAGNDSLMKLDVAGNTVVYEKTN